MNRKTLETKILQLLDGNLEENGRSELIEALKTDPEALKLYCQYAELDALVYRQIKNRAALGQEQALISRVKRRRSQTQALRAALLSAAAILLLLGAVLHLTHIPPKAPLLSYKTSPDTILTVTHFESGEPPPADSMLAADSRMVITQGSAEFIFRNGIRAVLQAPVDLTVRAEDEVFLKEGSAFFEVPEEAVGFRVQTPEVLVTDLGTEFAIHSNPEKDDEVHVLSGKVQIGALLGLKHERLATTGFACRIDPAGRLHNIPLRSDKFATTLPSSLPHFHMSFDSLTEGRLEISGTLPMIDEINPRLVSSEASNHVPGVSGTALRLYGNGDFIETDWQGFEGTRPRTVAFWVKLPSDTLLPDLPAIVGWGTPSYSENSKFKILFSRDNPERRLLPRISFGYNYWFDGSTDLRDSQWHHIAVTYSGELLDDGLPKVAVYIDGKKETLINRSRSPSVAKVAPSTKTHGRWSRPLRIGKGIRKYQHTFQGMIDEFVIYDGVISETSLQKLIQTHEP